MSHIKPQATTEGWPMRTLLDVIYGYCCRACLRESRRCRTGKDAIGLASPASPALGRYVIGLAVSLTAWAVVAIPAA